MCDCISNGSPNRCPPNGTHPVVLTNPWTGHNISIDACIVPDIEMLWVAGIRTYGCCCGHNGIYPRSVIVDRKNAEEATRLLEGNLDVVVSEDLQAAQESEARP